ncbi:hypothetical protein C1H46_045806 [Malus baccata]|uniref:Uncharacterized protein n=1 Tax=Malus baccata TaxID=106549 RepID=A0A540K330_MALBA|nr:hypothetical protein C1H46_045806 [Malus baccata]
MVVTTVASSGFSLLSHDILRNISKASPNLLHLTYLEIVTFQVPTKPASLRYFIKHLLETLNHAQLRIHVNERVAHIPSNPIPVFTTNT